MTGLLQHFKTIEPRHLNIQKHQVGFQPIDHFATLQPILRLANQFDLPGMFGQQLFQPVACRLLVVGNQGAVSGSR